MRIRILFTTVAITTSYQGKERRGGGGKRERQLCCGRREDQKYTGGASKDSIVTRTGFRETVGAQKEGESSPVQAIEGGDDENDDDGEHDDEEGAIAIAAT